MESRATAGTSVVIIIIIIQVCNIYVYNRSSKGHLARLVHRDPGQVLRTRPRRRHIQSVLLSDL